MVLSGGKVRFSQHALIRSWRDSLLGVDMPTQLTQDSLVERASVWTDDREKLVTKYDYICTANGGQV